jgi:hypothetical protein
MVPANSIAPSARALGRRVRAILDRRIRERPSGSAWTAVAMLLCIGIAAPVAAMQLVAADPPAPPATPPAPAASAAAPSPTAPSAAAAPAAPAAGGTVISVADAPLVPPIADEVLRGLLPQVPTIIAGATAGFDPEELEQAMREARRELSRSQRLTREQRREIERALRRAQQARTRVVIPHAQIETALRSAERARTVVIPHAEIEAAMVRVRTEVPRAIAVSMAHSADGMIHGADGMERGARNMEAQAERLQDRDYRERAIARARERGETVTHEDLLRAAEGLREGAEGMREGAREMRAAAERMRGRGHN